MKQWGEWLPAIRDVDGVYRDDGGDEMEFVDFPKRAITRVEGQEFWRVGKKRAGATLDGREHREFPG